MLRLLQKKEDELLRFCEKDVFGTKIAAYLMTYGTEYPFALFYLQENGKKVIAALCKIDEVITLCCDDNTDFEELGQFIRTVGYENIMCALEVSKSLKSKPKETGFIVEFKNMSVTSKKSKNNDICYARGVELSDIYDILKHSDFGGLGDRMQWLSDVSFRLKQGTAAASAAEECGKPVACAMILFETKAAALIGAVATLPDFRGKGYAGTLVTSLATAMKEKNKRADLLCARGSIIDFYRKIGFEKTGEWSLI